MNPTISATKTNPPATNNTISREKFRKSVTMIDNIITADSTTPFFSEKLFPRGIEKRAYIVSGDTSRTDNRKKSVLSLGEPKLKPEYSKANETKTEENKRAKKTITKNFETLLDTIITVSSKKNKNKPVLFKNQK